MECIRKLAKEYSKIQTVSKLFVLAFLVSTLVLSDTFILFQSHTPVGIDGCYYVLQIESLLTLNERSFGKRHRTYCSESGFVAFLFEAKRAAPAPASRESKSTMPDRERSDSWDANTVARNETENLNSAIQDRPGVRRPCDFLQNPRFGITTSEFATLRD